MTIATEDEKRSRELALLAIYKPFVQAFVITLGFYYLLIAGAHLAMLTGKLALIMSGTAATSAIVLLFARFTYLRFVDSMRGLEIAMICLGSLPVINITAHGYLARDPSQFVYLLMFAFGVAMIGPSLRVVGTLLAFVFCSATFLTVTGPEGAYVNNVFTTMTAVGGGVAAGRFLHGLVRSQVEARALTERLLKSVEVEVIRNKELAVEADAANVAKADFLANMSHELRTPLNGIVGITHALAATDLVPRQREMLDLIENSGQVLTRLLSDILDLSKIEAGKIDIERAPFHLREEINAAAFLLQTRAAEKGLAFKVSYCETAAGWFEGDVTRVKQIISNLTSNAIKFTHEGNVSLAINWSDASEVLEIRVTDTGIGFDEEAGKRLFQRFMQADTSITRRFGGTGLGLSICRGLVDAMGGGMDWSSRVGKGTSFLVRLPMPACEAPEVVQTTAIGAQVDTEDTIRILVAEDHLTNQKVLSMILEPLGVALTICENGALALEAFKDQAYDVVLMDMQMPVMGGVAATQAIRALEAQENLAHTPIIMLTANAMRQHRIEGKRAGADMHVTKPFTPTELIAAIESVLQIKHKAIERDTALVA